MPSEEDASFLVETVLVASPVERVGFPSLYPPAAAGDRGASAVAVDWTILRAAAAVPPAPPVWEEAGDACLGFALPVRLHSPAAVLWPNVVGILAPEGALPIGSPGRDSGRR